MTDQPKATSVESLEQLEKRIASIRGLYYREHSLLNERTNVLLVCQSILMAGLVLGSEEANFLPLVLSSLGLFISLMWLYIGWRTLTIADYFSSQLHRAETLLPQDDRIHSLAREWRGNSRPRFGIRTSICLAVILPALWLIIWSVAMLWRLAR